MIVKIPEQLRTQVVLWHFFFDCSQQYNGNQKHKAEQDWKTFSLVRKETSLKLGLKKLVAKEISTMRKQMKKFTLKV